ncbi:MAG: nucleoside-diphosphate kinase [Acidobacteria bacterium RIFCSPLOWO2_02_FULL_61_28]|nr:MAG: nucleoside-diphosphate kinase [Acidobacteria bacterium RIFCSPLOWO2_02_FULL_61_28]
MAVTRTLTIIKPDGVAQNNIGDVLRTFEENKFKIVAMKMLRLTKQQAEGFYAVHRGKPFFESLTTFMSSGRIVVMVLEGEDAINRLRAVMGATNPANAAEGTLRKRFATSIEHNIIHGSDAPDTAAFEIGYFFSEMEIVS